MNRFPTYLYTKLVAVELLSYLAIGLYIVNIFLVIYQDNIVMVLINKIFWINYGKIVNIICRDSRIEFCFFFYIYEV